MSIQSPNLGSLPLPVLQQAVMGQVPGVMPYEALSQIQKIVERTKLQQAMQNQQALSQPTPPTVAQQVMGEAQGIMGALPQNGQPRGFAEGGGVMPYGRNTGFGNMSPEEWAIQRIRERTMGAYRPRRDRLEDQIPGTEWREHVTRPEDQIPLTKWSDYEESPPVQQNKPVQTRDDGEPVKVPSRGISKIQEKGTGVRGALPKTEPAKATGIAQALTTLTGAPAQGLGIMGLDERVQKQRDMVQGPMKEYDATMNPIAQYYDERLKAAQGKQMDQGTMFARMAQGMSGKQRFGDMLAGAAGAGADYQEKFGAEKQAAVEAAMSAKANLEKARLAYQSGRLEEAAGFIKAYEDDKLKAQQLAQAAKHQEEQLKFNREELAARERMAREQNATQLKAASMRTSGAGAGGIDPVKAANAVRGAIDAARKEVDSWLKDNPAKARKVNKEQIYSQRIREYLSSMPDIVAAAGVKIDEIAGAEPVQELFDSKKYPPIKP